MELKEALEIILSNVCCNFGGDFCNENCCPRYNADDECRYEDTDEELLSAAKIVNSFIKENLDKE